MFVHLHAYVNAKYRYILQLNNIIIANDQAKVRAIWTRPLPNAKLKIISKEMMQYSSLNY